MKQIPTETAMRKIQMEQVKESFQQNYKTQS